MIASNLIHAVSKLKNKTAGEQVQMTDEIKSEPLYHTGCVSLQGKTRSEIVDQIQPALAKIKGFHRQLNCETIVDWEAYTVTVTVWFLYKK